MKNIRDYRIEIFPISEIDTTDIGRIHLRKHHIKALIEIVNLLLTSYNIVNIITI